MSFHIFISYARKDSEKIANKIFDALSAIPDLTIWMDRSLELAENWMQQIEDEIKHADYVIAIISPDVHRSRRTEAGSSFVIKEISFAQLLHKPILPILLEGTHLPLQIADLQYIDFSKDFYEALERTVSHICAKADIVLQEFQRTPAVPYALQIMQKAYTKLNLTDLATDAERVYKQNYPDGPPVIESEAEKTFVEALWDSIGFDE